MPCCSVHRAVFRPTPQVPSGLAAAGGGRPVALALVQRSARGSEREGEGGLRGVTLATGARHEATHQLCRVIHCRGRFPVWLCLPVSLCVCMFDSYCWMFQYSLRLFISQALNTDAVADTRCVQPSIEVGSLYNLNNAVS